MRMKLYFRLSGDSIFEVFSLCFFKFLRLAIVDKNFLKLLCYGQMKPKILRVRDFERYNENVERNINHLRGLFVFPLYFTAESRLV